MASHSSSDITIRPLRASEQEAARRLILAGLGEHFGWIDETLNPDLRDIEAAYLRPGHCFLVAEIAGTIAGTGALVSDAPGVGRIVRVSVDQRYRGRGIGRRLVQQLLAAAHARGYQRVVCETNDDWDAAIALYRACGFAEEARRDGSVHFALDLTFSAGIAQHP
jgi:ribosomal protein S18 acetylase RimI-like enzyme